MAKKKNLIPKKIAGLKVPKTLRKSKTLRSLLGSATGREILANALTAGAGAAAAALLRHREEVGQAAAQGARRGGRTLSVVNDAIHDGTTAIMGVVTDAARSVLSEHQPRSRPRGEDGGR